MLSKNVSFDLDPAHALHAEFCDHLNFAPRGFAGHDVAEKATKAALVCRGPVCAKTSPTIFLAHVSIMIVRSRTR